jgi:hypothetical protein
MKFLYFKSLFIAFMSLSIVTKASPLYFIENKGQITDQFRNSRADIDLSLQGKGMTLFIGDGQLHYQFAKSEQSETDSSYATKMYRLDMELVGADKNAPLIKEDLHYYTERYYTDLFGVDGATARSYGRVIYKNVYPQIDWVLYIKDGGLKHEFVVREGGNASLIKLKYSGATSIQLANNGSFKVSTPLGDVSEASPYSYNSKGESVASSFKLRGDELSFNVAPYEGELTIDPAVAWSTYYGGVDVDQSTGVTHDAAGNVYLVGYTISVSNISTIGSHQYVFSGGWQDGYMAKLDQLGNRIWGTYYGGINGDAVTCVAVDNNNKVYIGGNSGSTSGIATPGTQQPTSINGSAFLAKFDTTGVRLWGTYYGPGSVSLTKIECDNTGGVYVCGSTTATSGISTPGVHQTQLSGMSDAFLAKFNGSGLLTWATYYGGAQNETCPGLCIDNSGNVYISGTTLSDTGISTPSSHQPVKAQSADVFLAKFNSSGTRLWGTYYGGNHNDGEMGGLCAYNGNGSIYLAGSTRSADNIATTGCLQFTPSYVFEVEAFVVKFDQAGVREWGTYYGGLGSEQVSIIACDNTDNVFVGGYGFSVDLGTACSPQNSNAGNGDIFVFKLSSNCEDLWSTYLGGVDQDLSTDCDYDGNGNLYVCGYAYSTTGFGSPNVHQPDLAGQADGFLEKYIDCAVPGQTSGVTGNTPVCQGDTVTYYAGALCGANSYFWDVPNDWDGYSIADTIVVIVGSTGAISVYGDIGCGNTSPQSLNVTVHPAPVPVITQNGTLISTTTNYLDYQWGHNGVDIFGASFPFYVMTDITGFYTVTVTDTNGCKGFSNITPLPLSAENVLMKDVKVYPNPARDIVYVEGLTDNIGYEVRNMLGVKLRDGVLKNGNDNISIADIPKGIYLLKIGSSSIKLVKE